MTKGTLNQLPSTIVRELTGANGCVLRESIDSTDGKPNLFVMASANSPEKSVNFYCSKVVSASYSLEAFEVTCDNTFSTWEDGTTTASSSLRVTRNNEVTEFTLASTTEGNTTQMSCEVEN